jgi:hypothetical protein
MAGKGTAVMGNNFYERPLAGPFMSPPGPIRLYEGGNTAQETLNNNNAEAAFSWKMLTLFYLWHFKNLYRFSNYFFEYLFFRSCKS